MSLAGLVWPLLCLASSQGTGADWGRFELAGAYVAPGERASAELAVPPGSDGSTSLPLTVLRGAEAGPTLLLVAGVHGCEYAPILALKELAQTLDPAALRGTLILVHLANPPAFAARSIYYGADGKNLNRTFPGRSDGTLSERIAHTLLAELVARADYVVDLHAGDGNERLMPYVTFVDEEELAPSTVERMRGMALAMGFDCIKLSRGRSRDPAASVFLSNAGFLAGKPTIAVESGQLGEPDRADIERILGGLAGLFVHLGLQEGAPRSSLPRLWIEGDRSVKSTHDGLFTRTVEPGQLVRAGQVVGRLSDVRGNALAEVLAPIDGCVLYVMATPPARTGETLLSVGTVRPSPPAWAVPGTTGTSGDEWPVEGGPSHDYVRVSGPPLAEAWPDTGPPVRWRRALGEGYAGLVFDGERLFTQLLVEREEHVVALDPASGATLWSQAAPAVPYEELDPQFGPGPNSTPLVVDGRVFVIGTGGQMRCLAARDGTLQWASDLHARFGRIRRKEEYGFSAAPLAEDGVILVALGGERHGVVALEPSSGELRWGSAPFAVSYAQPVLLTVAGRRQLVLFTPSDVRGLELERGELLWSFPVECFTGNNLTPALRLDDEHLWIASQLDGATRVLRLQRAEHGLQATQVWRDARMTQAHWHSFVRDGVVYGSLGGNFESEFGAIDWSTGEVLWRHEGFHCVKGVLAGDTLAFLDEQGTLGLARFDPSGFELLASHPLLRKEAWTPPILVGALLVARDRHEVVAVELGTRPAGR